MDTPPATPPPPAHDALVATPPPALGHDLLATVMPAADDDRGDLLAAVMPAADDDRDDLLAAVMPPQAAALAVCSLDVVARLNSSAVAAGSASPASTDGCAPSEAGSYNPYDTEGSLVDFIEDDDTDDAGTDDEDTEDGGGKAPEPPAPAQGSGRDDGIDPSLILPEGSRRSRRRPVTFVERYMTSPSTRKFMRSQYFELDSDASDGGEADSESAASSEAGDDGHESEGFCVSDTELDAAMEEDEEDACSEAPTPRAAEPDDDMSIASGDDGDVGPDCGAGGPAVGAVCAPVVGM